jgi:hypothetical protein
MDFKEKVKETIISRATEGLAVSVSIIVIWVSSKVGPVILPAIESSLSKSLLVSLLLASLALNIVFLGLFRVFRKKIDFRLKYGIYWDSDKNPHCPNCKIPISGYDKYITGWGYYCKPCNKVFPLSDASGNDVKPHQAISEL